MFRCVPPETLQRAADLVSKPLMNHAHQCEPSSFSYRSTRGAWVNWRERRMFPRRRCGTTVPRCHQALPWLLAVGDTGGVRVAWATSRHSALWRLWRGILCVPLPGFSHAPLLLESGFPGRTRRLRCRGGGRLLNSDPAGFWRAVGEERPGSGDGGFDTIESADLESLIRQQITPWITG